MGRLARFQHMEGASRSPKCGFLALICGEKWSKRFVVVDNE